jgi:hypothetical protein
VVTPITSKVSWHFQNKFNNLEEEPNLYKRHIRSPVYTDRSLVTSQLLLPSIDSFLFLAEFHKNHFGSLLEGHVILLYTTRGQFSLTPCLWYQGQEHEFCHTHLRPCHSE